MKNGIIALICSTIGLLILAAVATSDRRVINKQKEEIQQWQDAASFFMETTKKPTLENFANYFQPQIEAKSMSSHPEVPWHIEYTGKSSILISARTGSRKITKIIPMPNGRYRQLYDELKAGDDITFKFKPEETLFVPYTNFLYPEKIKRAAPAN
jgi:hypothetical protein